MWQVSQIASQISIHFCERGRNMVSNDYQGGPETIA